MYKIVIRSIFYHWFALFIGISIGFLCNYEWVGHKYAIIERSISNIFFPVEYTKEIEDFVKNRGQLMLWSKLDCPSDFVIIDDLVKGEEFYWAIFKYKDKKTGKEIKGVDSIRVKWKSWEYYYKIDEPVVK